MNKTSKPSNKVELILMEGDKQKQLHSKKYVPKYSSTGEKNKMRKSKMNAGNEGKTAISNKVLRKGPTY